MRDDSRVDLFLVCGLAFILVTFSVMAFWRGADDREWEASWAALDDLDRAWLAAASRSSANRATLVERGELDLAKGFGRREMRSRANIALAILPLYAVAAILILTGLLSDRFADTVLITYLFVPNLVTYLRDRKIKSRYRETQDSYLAAHSAEPAPTA
jgi:hypothetical protein